MILIEDLRKKGVGYKGRSDRQGTLLENEEPRRETDWRGGNNDERHEEAGLSEED